MTKNTKLKNQLQQQAYFPFSMSSNDNKRIAKNSIFLYIRMLFVMCVAFYTSRVVLDALGVDNYGIYNVVGGLSSALIFFSSTLTVSTQRFLNFELGIGNINKVKNIFNSSLLLFSIIAIIVFIIGIPIGRWFVLNKLVIPDTQRDAAIIVLYSTIISLCATFIFSVYESVLISRENMKIYAYLGIIDALAKLGIAYIIIIVNNKLIVYAWSLMAVQLLPKLGLVIYCIKKYPEVKHEFYWNKSLLKELIGFTGWNLYGATVWMVNGQGISILLNMFFGPVVNAAQGIATQVNNAVNNFAVNFFTAVRPQIIKRYASKEYTSLISLIYSSSRFSFYLLWCISLPLILRCNYILSIWLKDVPDYAPAFVQWVLIYSMVNSFNNPIWTAMSATGNLKKSVLIGSNLFLLAFPLSYVALMFNVAPQIVYLLLSLGRFLFLIVTLHYISNYMAIDIAAYSKNVFFPIIKVIILSSIIGIVLNNCLPHTFIALLLICIIAIMVNAIAICLFGISSSEQNMIRKKIKELINKIKR